MQTLSTPYLGTPSHGLFGTLHGLSSPLRSIVNFFAPWTRAVAAASSLATPQVRPLSSRQAANANSFAAPRLVKPVPASIKPVRALRVIDSSCTAQSAGRMKIVGRLSDVCAELDRMCQDEVAA